jgi:hypothetical protein
MKRRIYREFSAADKDELWAAVEGGAVAERIGRALDSHGASRLSALQIARPT